MHTDNSVGQLNQVRYEELYTLCAIACTGGTYTTKDSYPPSQNLFHLPELDSYLMEFSTVKKVPLFQNFPSESNDDIRKMVNNG